MNEALLLNILRDAVPGARSYRPYDQRVTTLREFQLLVETAQNAQEEGLIEAFFQMPSKGKITAGLIRAFTVVSITQAGLARLGALKARPQFLPRPAQADVQAANAAPSP